MRSTARPAGPPPARSFRVTPVGRWWVAVGVVLSVLGWFKSIPPLLLFGYAMLALFGLNAWLARRQLGGVSAARVPHPPVYAGEPLRVALRVRNDGPRPVTAGVADAPETGGVAGLFEHLAPGAEAGCSATRTFPTRGVVGREPPRLWSDFPLGLVRLERPAAAGGELLVLPPVGDVDLEGFRRWVHRQSGVEGQSRRRVARSAADRTDTRGVRPIRPGDGRRDIHWKTTARRGEPYVREYDAAPDPELLLVVEPWLPAGGTAADAASLEASLSLAATLVRDWCQVAGTRVTLCVAGDEALTRSSLPTQAAARYLLSPLAGVAGTARPAVPTDLGGGAARSARVVVSSRPNSPLAAALGRAAGRPFAAAAPADRPAWYRPPPPGPR